MRSPHQRVIVYDLETGGLEKDINGVAEIAMVVVDMETLEIIDEYTSLIQPYLNLEYSDEAFDVTKLSLDILKNEGLPFDIVAKNCLEFIDSYKVGNSKPILAGHNIKKFDNPFFIKFMEDSKIDVTKHINLEESVDTLKWARWMFYELANYELGTVASELGITLVEAHRALPDTIANAKVFIKMIKQLRGEGSGGSSYTRRKFNFNF